MSRYRIYELAKEFKTENKILLSLLTERGYAVKNHMSSVGDEEREMLRGLVAGTKKKEDAKPKETPKPAGKKPDTPVKEEKPKTTAQPERPTETPKPTEAAKPAVSVPKPTAPPQTSIQKPTAPQPSVAPVSKPTQQQTPQRSVGTQQRPQAQAQRPQAQPQRAGQQTPRPGANNERRRNTFQNDIRWAEHSPRTQQPPQGVVRKPQDTARRPQDAVRRPQDGPNRPQDNVRRPQEGPNRPQDTRPMQQGKNRFGQSGGHSAPTAGRNGQMQGAAAGAGRPQQNTGGRTMNSQNHRGGSGSGDGNRRPGGWDNGNRRGRDNSGNGGNRNANRGNKGNKFDNRGGANGFVRDNRENRGNRKNRKNKNQQPVKVEIARPTHIKIGESIAVRDLASKMSCMATDVIKKLFLMGVVATINQEIDYDTAELVASEFGVTTEALPPETDPTEIPTIEDDPKTLVLRPPVVTVMGHVDHGKTSLLDVIRKSSVTSHEAGGITQHIGAYQVNCQGKKIVFLDTPGHEAFTAMRARGAQVTDIAILVVAADDGVMPQTIEAIHHAKAANVPIVVAINKIDKPGANPDHVKQQLSEQGLISEEWGGDVIMVPVSAKKQLGINDLLETILLVAEVQELKANPNREARGVIIEAQLDKGRGPVATVLVQSGTLRVGDSIIAGTAYGKVRAMINDRGENVKKASPSIPVEVLGLSDVPAAGDDLAVLDEKLVRSIAEKRIEKQRTELIRSKKVSLDDLFQQIQAGHIKDLNIVIKADVQGSVEALTGSLLALNKNEEVRVNIVHSGVGAVSESDVMLAAAANALIIAFNVRPDANARRAADAEEIDIRAYQVIYDALNDVKAAMSGMLAPKYKEVIRGKVEIRQVMKFAKLLVAGCYVLDGKVMNNSKIRIIRDNIVVFDGEIDSLRRFKDDVKEVAAGYECGLTIKDYRDFKEGDILEVYEMEEIAASIADLNVESGDEH